VKGQGPQGPKKPKSRFSTQKKGLKGQTPVGFSTEEITNLTTDSEEKKAKDKS